MLMCHLTFSAMYRIVLKSTIKFQSAISLYAAAATLVFSLAAARLDW